MLNDPTPPFYHSQFSAVQPVPGAGHALAILLRDKNEQLDVDNHERHLIAINDGCRAHAINVRHSCAFINFHLYPNFDGVYFEESPGTFHLVYDRQAWPLMESGKLPEDAERCSLVASWIVVRLSGNWPGALATDLQICWERPSADWLTDGGRDLFEMEAHPFLQKCEWDTPRMFWELFRGPLQGIVDERPKASPIVPPPHK